MCAVSSFPGAEGFGACATGGRGGGVCEVTSLGSAGPGTLADCVGRAGPTTVVFRVSGVIAGPIELTRPDLTLAGQTSPGGVVITGGLLCDNIYTEGSDCRNLVIRHLRLRRSDSDALRLGGTSDVIVDHVSMANASDESLELSRSHRVTIQHSLLAEPVGEHYRWGGLLMNYSTAAHPLDLISIHHNVWNGVFGRLPEVSCEENDDAVGTNCSGHTVRLELASNLLFDVSDPIWHNRCTGTNEGNDCAPADDNVRLALNWVDNLMVRRGGNDDEQMIERNVTRAPGSEVFYAGNRMCRGASCATVALEAPSRAARHDFPMVSGTAATELPTALATAGAWPRDPMDARLAGYLVGAVDARPPAWTASEGIDRGDALTLVTGAPPPPADGDHDGMPDDWERAHGLDPAAPGAAATTLAGRGGAGVVGCTTGYTDLECYLAELAATRLGR